MECPCEECLKLAICRFREFDNIVSNCRDIQYYLWGELSLHLHKIRVKEFTNVIKPYSWELGKEVENGFILEEKNK